MLNELAVEAVFARAMSKSPKKMSNVGSLRSSVKWSSPEHVRFSVSFETQNAIQSQMKPKSTIVRRHSGVGRSSERKKPTWSL